MWRQVPEESLAIPKLRKVYDKQAALYKFSDMHFTVFLLIKSLTKSSLCRVIEQTTNKAKTADLPS